MTRRSNHDATCARPAWRIRAGVRLRCRSLGLRRRRGQRGAAAPWWSRWQSEKVRRQERQARRQHTAGEENRNPFRSYVVRIPGALPREISKDGSDICAETTTVAPNYSLRSLRLLGIVLRGTRSYALFRDSGGLGHIVRRGDCLGKEQARVDTIGSGYVRLSVTPAAPPGAPAPPPQTRDIPLHPKEISLERTETQPVEEP